MVTKWLTFKADVYTDGNAGNAIHGMAGADTIVGLGGNDILDGGSGSDILKGGSGNDIFYADNILDKLVELSGQGVDTVRSSVNWTLGTFFENLTLTGNAAINGTGNAGGNVMVGNNAVNILIGNGGNDTLKGGGGADNLRGGTGNDWYYVDNTQDSVVELSGQGTDKVLASKSFTLSANVENLALMGTAAIDGTGNTGNNILIGNAANNVLSGDAGNDTLDGGGGNDTLDGGTGADILKGGAGDDLYVLGDENDTVIDTSGNDTITSIISRSLLSYASIENLTLLGSGSIDATGNALNNQLIGTSGANHIAGGLGDDNLTGGSGNDVFVYAQSDFGHDTITDFSAGAGAGDTIQIDVPTSGLTGLLTNFISLLTNTVDDGLGNTVITVPFDGSSITLMGVVKANLSIDDFSFVLLT